MSLKVTFDSNGLKRIPFLTLRDDLLALGRAFDQETLCRVPYESLALCASGEASHAACAIELVRQEKRDRRRNFLYMSTEEFTSMRRYLQAQGMFSDTHYERQLLGSVRWMNLDPLQRAYYLLVCVHNHIDRPAERVHNAVSELEKACDIGLIPMYTSARLADILNGLVAQYPSQLGTEDFRSSIAFYVEEVMQAMSAEERELCTEELIADYPCTSDCFQPTLRSVELHQ